MKICIGYYDKDGNYIGKTLDDPKRDKFFIAMGNVKKKISEHEGQSPYKNHRVEDWTKTYCDKTKIDVHFDVYINGKLNRKITNCSRWYYWKNDEDKAIYELVQKMVRHLKDRLEAQIMDKYGIEQQRRMYYPVYV